MSTPNPRRVAVGRYLRDFEETKIVPNDGWVWDRLSDAAGMLQSVACSVLGHDWVEDNCSIVAHDYCVWCSRRWGKNTREGQ